jgi:hypothetical protein
MGSDISDARAPRSEIRPLSLIAPNEDTEADGPIDAEFNLPPERINEYLAQFRPFELPEIKQIALNPPATDKSTATGGLNLTFA